MYLNNNMKQPSFENHEVENMIKLSDIVVDSGSGFAMVVIKPDAFSQKDQIIRKLENSGLYVVQTKTRNFPDRFVSEVMYKDMPEGIKNETIKHFNDGPAEIVLVKGGDDILQKLVEVTGEKTNPNECDTDSIRYVFGEHFGRETEDGKTYYRNAVHRAKDQGEQKDDLKKFRDASLS